MCSYACAMLGLSSSGVTVMWSFTRVGLSVSTVLLTMTVRSPRLGRTRNGAAEGLGLWGRDVGATGFEPATSRSQSGRSTKLSYAPGGLHTRAHAERP